MSDTTNGTVRQDSGTFEVWHSDAPGVWVEWHSDLPDHLAIHFVTGEVGGSPEIVYLHYAADEAAPLWACVGTMVVPSPLATSWKRPSYGSGVGAMTNTLTADVAPWRLSAPFRRQDGVMGKTQTRGESPKTSTRVPPHVLRALDERAELEGRTRAGLMRRILCEAVAQLEPNESVA